MDKVLSEVTMKEAVLAVGDLVMPRICAVCGEPLNLSERHICLPCLCDMPLTHFWERDRNAMADKYNARFRANPSVPSEAGQFEGYGYAAALFYYNSESAYKEIPHKLKYENCIDSGRFFADMLGRKLHGCKWLEDIDTVIPVPLHRLRLYKRGYNQAAIIAERLAAALGSTYRPKALKRTAYSSSQTGKSMSEKSRNVQNAFKVNESFSSRHILLVDDTFTTGSTLAACHDALREVFPPSVRISVATLCYVGP